MTVKDLREKRNRIVTEARSIMTRAETESRSLTSDEEVTFDRMTTEAETIGTQLRRMDQLSTLEQEQSESRGRMTRDETRAQNTDELRSWLLGAGEYRSNNNYALNLSQHPMLLGETRSQWEARAQAVGTASAGGYLAPTQFQAEVEKALLAFGNVRGVARVIRTASGTDLNWPLVDDTANVGAIVAENAGDTEQDVVFGSKTLKSFLWSSKIVRVSRELIEDSAVDVSALVGGLLGERLGRGQNAKFTTGTATSEPEGIVTGSTLGVTAASATAITSDEIVDLIFSLGAAYRPNASFMLSSSSLKLISKLKDSTGQYLLRPDFAGGIANTIAGYSYVVNDDMASVATGNKTILFGDFSKYIVRDVASIELVRLQELYAVNRQVGFVALMRSSGHMLDAGQHPIRHLKQA